jgi:glycosyltransferase involved in cell wall biosynthesis
MSEKKRIRILFLIGSYSTGGKERQLAELIKGLPGEQFELHLFVKSDGAHYLKDLQNKLTSFHSLERKRFGRKAFRDILRHIKTVKPHIVHSWADTTSFYLVLAKPFSRQKYILVDGSIRMAPERVKKFSMSNLKRTLIIYFSNTVVANSRAGLLSFHVPESKGHCIHNGFDNTRISDLKHLEALKHELGIRTTFTVGMVARFDHEKDWFTFLSAAEMVLALRNDVTFIAVGGGPDLPKFRNKIKHINRQKIIFTGERDDVESIVNILDIGVLASYSEGISNSIIEYMALSKPVIASGFGGIPELIVHNNTGIIFPVGDNMELCNTIILLLNDETLRIRLGKSGEKRIRDLFSFEQMILNYNELYKQILNAK